MILASITASSLYWVSVTYGVASVSAALGRDRSVEFFTDPSSSLAMVCLPLLPWGILGLKVVRLEVQILRVWHRVVMPVVYSLLKRVPGVRLLDLRPTLYTPTPVAIFPHVSRCIVGTFALPAVSCILGWMYSHFLHNTTNFKRTLLVSPKLYVNTTSARTSVHVPLVSTHKIYVTLSPLQGGVSYLLASYSVKVCLENYRATSLARQREMTDSSAT